MRRFVLRVTFFALMVVALSCGRSGERAGGGVLTVLKAKPPLSLDPACAVAIDSVEIISQIYEPLLKISENGEVVAHLAKSVTSKDDVVWTIELRRGIRFHDGREMTARDVVATFMRQMRGAAGKDPIPGCSYAYWKTYFSSVRKVEAKGEYIVEITLAKPSPLFRYYLTLFPVSVIPANRARGMTLSEHPIGTGPYEYVEIDEDGNVLLRSFSGYWGGGYSSRFKYIKMEAIPSERRRLLALRGGAGDVVMDFDYKNLAPLSLHPSIRVEKSPGSAILYLAFNTRKPPFDDVANRLAVAYAIERTKLVEYVYQGNAEVLDCPFPCNMKLEGSRVITPEMLTRLPWRTPSPQNSRALLRTTGILQRTEPVTLYVVDKPRAYLPSPMLVAEIIARSLRRVGLKVKIVSRPYKRFKEELKEGKHDMAIHGWIPDYPAPSTYLYPLLYTPVKDGRPVYNSAFNIANYFSPDFNAPLERALRVNDVSLQIEHYREAVRVFWRELPWVPIAAVRYVVLHSSRIEGVRASGMGLIDYSKVRPARQR